MGDGRAEGLPAAGDVGGQDAVSLMLTLIECIFMSLKVQN